MFFPLWSFPFLLEKKQSKQTTRETTNALPELREREREREKRFIKRRRETERDLALSRRKKEERCVVSFPPLLLKRLRRYPHRQRGVSLRKTKINRSNRISSPEEEEEEKERGKKNLRKNERETNKDPPHHVDACVCVLFLLLCPRLNVRLQKMCVDEMCCFFYDKVLSKKWVDPSRKKLILTKTSKKNIKQPTTVADRRTQIIIIISRCTWICCA